MSGMSGLGSPNSVIQPPPVGPYDDSSDVGYSVAANMTRDGPSGSA
eukprot:COSAG02_NODE_1796_length_10904_cov_23.136603_8_plen_46_part_00